MQSPSSKSSKSPSKKRGAPKTRAKVVATPSRGRARGRRNLPAPSCDSDRADLEDFDAISPSSISSSSSVTAKRPPSNSRKSHAVNSLRKKHTEPETLSEEKAFEDPVRPPKKLPGSKSKASISSVEYLTPNASANRPQWLNTARGLLKSIESHDLAQPFKQPVDAEGLGLFDYFTIVIHPMDLGTVRTRLEGGAYPSPTQFLVDIDLIFENALLYNPMRDPVYKSASKLQKEFHRLAAVSFPDVTPPEFSASHLANSSSQATALNSHPNSFATSSQEDASSSSRTEEYSKHGSAKRKRKSAAPDPASSSSSSSVVAQPFVDPFADSASIDGQDNNKRKRRALPTSVSVDQKRLPLPALAVPFSTKEIDPSTITRISPTAPHSSKTVPSGPSFSPIPLASPSLAWSHPSTQDPSPPPSDQQPGLTSPPCTPTALPSTPVNSTPYSIPVPVALSSTAPSLSKLSRASSASAVSTASAATLPLSLPGGLKRNDTELLSPPPSTSPTNVSGLSGPSPLPTPVIDAPSPSKFRFLPPAPHQPDVELAPTSPIAADMDMDNEDEDEPALSQENSADLPTPRDHTVDETVMIDAADDDSTREVGHDADMDGSDESAEELGPAHPLPAGLARFPAAQTRMFPSARSEKKEAPLHRDNTIVVNPGESVSVSPSPENAGPSASPSQSYYQPKTIEIPKPLPSRTPTPANLSPSERARATKITDDMILRKGKLKDSKGIKNLSYDICGSSFIGHFRKTNQDAFCIEARFPDMLVFGVFDGHGALGDIAARLCAETLVGKFAAHLHDNHPVPVAIRLAFREVNDLLLAIAASEEEAFKERMKRVLKFQPQVPPTVGGKLPLTTDAVRASPLFAPGSPISPGTDTSSSPQFGGSASSSSSSSSDPLLSGNDTLLTRLDYGTTAVFAVVKDKTMYVANVGDSRAIVIQPRQSTAAPSPALAPSVPPSKLPAEAKRAPVRSLATASSPQKKTAAPRRSPRSPQPKPIPPSQPTRKGRGRRMDSDDEDQVADDDESVDSNADDGFAQILALTRDHNPSTWTEERKRVEVAGNVFHTGQEWRVHPKNLTFADSRKYGLTVNMSRALGHVELSKHGVIPEPDIRELEMKSGDSLFVVLASDGLWHVMDNHAVSEVVLSHKSLGEACSQLIQQADDEWKNTHVGDNISVVLAQFTVS